MSSTVIIVFIFLVIAVIVNIIGACQGKKIAVETIVDVGPIACVADAAAVIVANRGAEVGVGVRQPNKEADVEAILRIVFQVTTRNIIRRHRHHWRSSRERDSSQSNWRRRSDASNSQDNSSCSSQLKWSELQSAKLWMYMWQFPATIAGFSFVLCCVVLSLVRVAGARPTLQA